MASAWIPRTLDASVEVTVETGPGLSRRHRPLAWARFVVSSDPVSGKAARGAKGANVGQRTPRGRTGLRRGRPVGPGGVSARLGANPRAEDDPVDDETEVTG